MKVHSFASSITCCPTFAATALAVFAFASLVRADEKPPTVSAKAGNVVTTGPGGPAGGGTLTVTAGENGPVAASPGILTITGGTLIESGTWLGLATDALSAPLAAQLPIDKGTGLLISHVFPEGPAQLAGLEVNDVLLKFDDQLLINPAQLRVLVRTKKGGDSVKLSYYRKGAPREATVSLKVIVAGPDGKVVMFDRFVPLPAAGSTGEGLSKELEKEAEAVRKSGASEEAVKSVQKALQDAVKQSEDKSAAEPKTPSPALLVEATITDPPPANAGKNVVTIVESIPSITVESGKPAIIQVGKLEYTVTPTLLDDGTVEIRSTVTQGGDKKAEKLIIPTMKTKLGNVAELRIGQIAWTIKISLAK